LLDERGPACKLAFEHQAVQPCLDGRPGKLGGIRPGIDEAQDGNPEFVGQTSVCLDQILLLPLRVGILPGAPGNQQAVDRRILQQVECRGIVPMGNDVTDRWIGWQGLILSPARHLQRSALPAGRNPRFRGPGRRPPQNGGDT
jgi:hypothetical protein